MTQTADEFDESRDTGKKQNYNLSPRRIFQTSIQK